MGRGVQAAGLWGENVWHADRLRSGCSICRPPSHRHAPLPPHTHPAPQVSALVASEWYMRNNHFPGWAQPYEFASEILAQLKRKEEARDLARWVRGRGVLARWVWGRRGTWPGGCGEGVTWPGGCGGGVSWPGGCGGSPLPASVCLLACSPMGTLPLPACMHAHSWAPCLCLPACMLTHGHPASACLPACSLMGTLPLCTLPGVPCAFPGGPWPMATRHHRRPARLPGHPRRYVLLLPSPPLAALHVFEHTSTVEVYCRSMTCPVSAPLPQPCPPPPGFRRCTQAWQALGSPTTSKDMPDHRDLYRVPLLEQEYCRSTACPVPAPLHPPRCTRAWKAHRSPTTPTSRRVVRSRGERCPTTPKPRREG